MRNAVVAGKKHPSQWDTKENPQEVKFFDYGTGPEESWISGELRRNSERWDQGMIGFMDPATPKMGATGGTRENILSGLHEPEGRKQAL